MNAYERYRVKTIRRVVLDLNANTDKDILSWLAVQSNKAGAIKVAIRKNLTASGAQAPDGEGKN